MISRETLEKLEYFKVLGYISKYANTDSGKKKILSTVPFDNKKEAEFYGEIVNQAKEILIKSTPPPIEYLPDLTEDIAKSNIEGSLLSNKKILEILKLAATSRLVVSFIKMNTETAPLLSQSVSRLFVDKVFEHHISKVIDENGNVKENASVKLKEIRKEIRSKSSDLVRSIDKIMKDLKDKEYVREDYLTLRDGRMVVPIKAEHKRHLKGFIHSESSTGQTVYIEPEDTLELNNEIISLNFAERREIERLLKELTKLVGGVSDKLKTSLSELAFIDSIFAIAKYSIEMQGAFPQIDNKKPFEIEDGRHPVLLKKLSRNKTVPLGFKLNDEHIIVITGPNAGGKTVVLKTIGLLSLLVQSGIHIPASADSNFHFFNKILIDIGDEQSIENDLSTFSSHLININEIINSCDKNSLILLDELGTGTDPIEGASLAIAVLMDLRDKGALVFASTHHGDLKIIAHSEQGFVNAAMEFDNEALTPTYRFKLGIPGSSYAFEIAKRIGIDNNIIEDAQRTIDSEKHKIEQFLIDIEAKSTALEKKIKTMELENSRLAGLSNLYKKNIEKIEKEKKEILKKVKNQADDYLSNINSKIEKVIKDLRESKASKEVIKESKKTIENVKEQTENLFAPAVELNEEITDFKEGDFVLVKNTAASGKIVSIDKEKKKAVLQVGSLKMQVNLDNLQLSKEKKSKPGSSSLYTGYIVNAKNYRLDIRGEKPDEAEFEVIKFLDESYVSGQDRVEILHGKGTGALKKTVTEILKGYDKVKSFHFAPVESGGEGITIVEFK